MAELAAPAAAPTGSYPHRIGGREELADHDRAENIQQCDQTVSVPF